MTLPMGWVIGMGLVTAIQATIISKVATGKYPWELGKDALDTIKNLTFPRIDKDDPTQRVSIPTYFRDAVHIYTSLQQDYGLGYIHSSMTGEINRLIEDWQNKDFSGKPIYNPLDPMHKRVLAKLEHLIPLPFGLSSYLRAEETGARGGKAALGFMGYTKAPSSVEPSTANRVYQMIDDWMAKSSDPKLHEKARRAAVQDQRKASEPSQYAPLRQALRVENEEGARKELAKLREAGKQDWQIQQALSYWKPVTGSWANEVAFEKSLKPDQRAMLDKLRQDRKLIYQRFIQLSKSQPSGE
jgi:hypothetical protein